MSFKNGGLLLKMAAFLSFGIALLHVVVIAIGSRAYWYFGARDLAQSAAQGSGARGRAGRRRAAATGPQAAPELNRFVAN